MTTSPAGYVWLSAGLDGLSVICMNASDGLCGWAQGLCLIEREWRERRAPKERQNTMPTHINGNKLANTSNFSNMTWKDEASGAR
jgi:hypothetical protein